MNINISTYMCIHIFIYIHVYIHVYMYICILCKILQKIHVWIQISDICIDIYIYMYTYLYTYIYSSTLSQACLFERNFQTKRTWQKELSISRGGTWASCVRPSCVVILSKPCRSGGEEPGVEAIGVRKLQKAHS